jgi:hypothetical protein
MIEAFPPIVFGEFRTILDSAFKTTLRGSSYQQCFTHLSTLTLPINNTVDTTRLRQPMIDSTN